MCVVDVGVVGVDVAVWVVVVIRNVVVKYAVGMTVVEVVLGYVIIVYRMDLRW